MKILTKNNLLLLGNKLIEKIPDPHYQSFIRKKNTKPVKQSEIISYQPKTFEKPNIVDIRSIITEHPKTLNKLSKPIRQAKKVDIDGPLYRDTKKNVKIF